MFDNIWPYLFLHQTAHGSLISSPIWLIQLELRKYNACPWSDKYLAPFGCIYFYIKPCISLSLFLSSPRQLIQLRQIHMIKQIFAYIWSYLFFIKMPVSCSSYQKWDSFNCSWTNMKPAHQTNIWLYLTLFVLTSNCPQLTHFFTNLTHSTWPAKIWCLPMIRQIFGSIWLYLFLHQISLFHFWSSPMQLIQLRQVHMIKQIFTYIWSCLCFIKMPISYSSYHKLDSFNWSCTNMRPAHQTNIWLYLTLFVLTSNCP
jgi:hypothetical protein